VNIMTDPFLSRRRFLGFAGTATAVAGLGVAFGVRPALATTYSVTYSDAEWLKRLGKARYAILREADTEVPFTSPLNNEHRKGTFLCAGCANELYSSTTKFDSGTGWPSFYQPLPHAVLTSTDFKLGYPRTEVHCSDCGGHLGHVFRDGPKPTGLRYCMNGLAMTFRPA
jgi:peptide-methionine (R)-S-oxide reductase